MDIRIEGGKARRRRVDAVIMAAIIAVVGMAKIVIDIVAAIIQIERDGPEVMEWAALLLEPSQPPYSEWEGPDNEPTD